MSAPDFLPLAPGLRLEYAVNRFQRDRVLVVEHSREDGGVIVRRRWMAPDGTSEFETNRGERRADGVYLDGEKVLPLPAVPGARWFAPPREYRVESVDGATRTPAGRFDGCLRVVYLIAGGDGGSGERLYAPGVGLVRETCHDEADPFEIVLTAFTPAASLEAA